MFKSHQKENRKASHRGEVFMTYMHDQRLASQVYEELQENKKTIELNEEKGVAFKSC